MHKVDSPGATIDNKFTEGNPALNILATEVSDDWLNDVQGSLVEVIEGVGRALVKGDDTQFRDSIFDMIGAGGTNIKLDPLVNNTADQVITGLLFDKTKTKAAVVYFDVHRETDSSNVQETGILVVTHDTKDDVWRLSLMTSGLDDAGAVFNVVAATGQVRVSTDDLTGASYAAQLRINSIAKMAL